MHATRFALTLVVFSVLAPPAVEGAPALARRTWVSGTGNDSHPCTRVEPCLTFGGAMQKTEDGGEIDALDAGDFGQLTITKSLTIDGGSGKVASVLVTTANSVAIAVNAGPTDAVTLRNLSLTGANRSSG